MQCNLDRLKNWPLTRPMKQQGITQRAFVHSAIRRVQRMTGGELARRNALSAGSRLNNRAFAIVLAGGSREQRLNRRPIIDAMRPVGRVLQHKIMGDRTDCPSSRHRHSASESPCQTDTWESTQREAFRAGQAGRGRSRNRTSGGRSLSVVCSRRCRANAI
jgi:hypothetical protein